jgi:hypothetical protein
MKKSSSKGATALMTVPSGDPIVTVNKVGKGSVVFVAVPDMLGEDERMTPFAAHTLAHVFADSVPVKVTGDVEYLINRTANGWVVTLLNNNGVSQATAGNGAGRSECLRDRDDLFTADEDCQRVDQRIGFED